MSLTRTIKFEVDFPGLRRVDALHVKGGLRLMSLDLTRAANRAISAMWLLQLGMYPWPQKEDGAPVSLQTLAYQLLSGKWQPAGRPSYEPGPDAPVAGSNVLVQLSNDVLTRINTDLQDIKAGRKSLATFREVPIPFPGSVVRPQADGSFLLSVYAGRKGNLLRVRPRKLDTSTNAIMHRIREGRYTHGSAKLWRDARNAKWFMALSWTDKAYEVATLPTDPAEATDVIVAGVDTGIQHACWVAFVNGATGEPLPKAEIVQFPSRTTRGVSRISRERRERLQYNRADLGLREGRGRTRKLRVVAAIGDKIDRMHTTMISQIAAATVNKIKERGATVMVIEDHSHWSETKMHRGADEQTRSEAARTRAAYYRWHQGAMRVALAQVGEREGLKVIEINPAYSSRTCHRCGAVWERDWIKHPPKGDEIAYGRVNLRQFRCECGHVGHADHNAAVNIARRGMEVSRTPVRTAAKRKAKASTG